MKSILQTTYFRLCTVTVFADVMEKSLFQRFFAYMRIDKTDEASKRKAYANFVKEIYEGSGVLTTLVEKLVSEDENVYVKNVAAKQPINDFIVQAAETELKTFSDFAALSPDDFALDMGVDKDTLPQFSSFNKDMGGVYEERFQLMVCSVCPMIEKLNPSSVLIRQR